MPIITNEQFIEQWLVYDHTIDSHSYLLRRLRAMRLPTYPPTPPAPINNTLNDYSDLMRGFDYTNPGGSIMAPSPPLQYLPPGHRFSAPVRPPNGNYNYAWYQVLTTSPLQSTIADGTTVYVDPQTGNVSIAITNSEPALPELDYGTNLP